MSDRDEVSTASGSGRSCHCQLPIVANYLA